MPRATGHSHLRLSMFIKLTVTFFFFFFWVLSFGCVGNTIYPTGIQLTETRTRNPLILILIMRSYLLYKFRFRNRPGVSQVVVHSTALNKAPSRY